jgi:hypothetical protein
MNIIQFDNLIDKVILFLQEDCIVNPEKYKKSGEEFEPCVKRAVDHAMKMMGLAETVDYTPGGHGFPDIIIEGFDGNKYGIEVKSSTGTGNTWRINGNSILGTTRVPGLRKTMIIFGRLRGADSIFRAKEYEKSISNVVVTHSPRYLIDLDIEEGNGFFEKSELSYEEISNSDQPIKRITDYFTRIGQTAWWLAESTPAAIQMFTNLTNVQQCKLMGYAFAHFTEIFSNKSTKFNRLSRWLASENSIIDPALRDRFTAGGKADVILSSVVYKQLPRIYTRLLTYRKYVLNELSCADVARLSDDWGQTPESNEEDRVEQWATLVASMIPDEHMDFVRKKQMLLEILREPL